MAPSETSLGRLDAIQRRAVKIMSEAPLSRNAIQPLAQRRQVGAPTLFHWIYNGDALTLLIAKNHQGINVLPHRCCSNSSFRLRNDRTQAIVTARSGEGQLLSEGRNPRRNTHARTRARTHARALTLSRKRTHACMHRNKHVIKKSSTLLPHNYF